MFKIIEESPTRQEKEFEAVKRLVIKEYRYTWIILAFLFIFPIITLFGCYTTQIDFLEGLTAGFIVSAGFFLLLYFFDVHPKRFNILYKRKNKEA